MSHQKTALTSECLPWRQTKSLIQLWCRSAELDIWRLYGQVCCGLLCLKHDWTVTHKTYIKRSGKLNRHMSSLHNWFPTARLPRNWIPQRRAAPQSRVAIIKQKQRSDLAKSVEMSKFRLTFEYGSFAPWIHGPKNTQEFKGYINETEFPAWKTNKVTHNTLIIRSQTKARMRKYSLFQF